MARFYSVYVSIDIDLKKDRDLIFFKILSLQKQLLDNISEGFVLFGI